MSVYSTVVCLVSLVTLTMAQTNGTRYDGYQLLRVHPTSSRQVAVLRELHDDEDLKLDFWTSPVLDREVDILVPPSSRSYVKRRMEKATLPRRVAVDNIQSSIDKEVEDMANARASHTGRSPAPSIVGTYARHSEINTWLTDIASGSNWPLWNLLESHTKDET